MTGYHRLYRPVLQKRLPVSWALIAGIFVVHALTRFGGLSNAMFVPLSMAILWPLPWLLSSKAGRRELGFRKPDTWWWFLFGPVIAVAVLGITALTAWLTFGKADANWFVQHAMALQESLGRLPEGTSVIGQFWIVTIPAMIFSPLAEEFLYRGYMLADFSDRWGESRAMIIQSSAFAFVHLAHYGLVPFQPVLLTIWLPSMFLTAWTLGWIVRKSDSLWSAVISHSVYNFGMNGIVFLFLPEWLGS